MGILAQLWRIVFARIKRFRAYFVFWKYLLLVVLSDQVTKCLVALNLPFPTYGYGYGHEPIVIVPDFFNLVHVRNEGAAWSIFSGQQFLLSAFAIVCLGLIFFCRKSLEVKNREMQLPMGLLCGGIIGNLIDRVFHGFVIDFLDVRLPIVDYHWPAFNIADCGICIGVFYFLILNLIAYYRELKNKAKGEPREYPDVDELSKK